MKRYLLLISMLCTLMGYSKEYPNCNYTYFANKAISTSVCFDENNRWGSASAFDKKGNKIYEKGLRTVGGHSSVHFSYYQNGAVKTAHWSSAPDGGIQWYRSTTNFSEDGKITSETKDSHDNGPSTLLAPGKPYQQYTTPPPPTKETVTTPSTVIECAVIYSSEYWFINTTPYTVIITSKHKHRKTETSSTTLKPGESKKGGYMIQAQFFDEPDKYYDFEAALQKSKIKQRLIILPSERKPENTNKETKRYYYDVRRII